MAEDVRKPLRLTTQRAFTHRITISTLTGRDLHLSHIRSNSPANTGLAPHEISFLRLVESVTNGSHIGISYTGTTLLYRPGLIVGSGPGSSATNGTLEHAIPAENTRGVSYFLIPLCLLAPFAKAPLDVLLTGPGVITSTTPTGDMSADSVRTAILPLYARFGIANNLELRILRRSNPGPGGRGGAGEVRLVFGHQVRLPPTVHLLNLGRVKRVRGVAYATGVAAANNARMIEAARGILNPLVPDTYVFADVAAATYVPEAKRKVGVGFGLALVAESSTGSLYSADVASPPEGGVPPEDIGTRCAHQLLESVSWGGAVSRAAAPTALVLMAMGSEDVGRVLLGREVMGSDEVVGLARDLKAFGMSAWGVREPDEGPDGIVVSIVGKGVGNVGRKLG